jgi:hypothetical protein
MSMYLLIALAVLLFAAAWCFTSGFCDYLDRGCVDEQSYSKYGAYSLKTRLGVWEREREQRGWSK